MPSIEDIINRQFRQWELERAERRESPPAAPPCPRIVTVSREAGSRGAHFAGLMAERLGFQLIHKEIIDAICRSSGYRKRIIASLDEQYRSRLEIMAQAFVTGQAVDHADYTRHLVEVVLSMSRLGGVVLIGRGGNFILGPQRGFHLRFVCPKPRRIENFITYRGMTADEAARFVEKLDAERRAMIRKLFGADIDDPHHYDLVINAAYIDIEAAVKPVVDAFHIKMDKLTASAA